MADRLGIKRTTYASYEQNIPIPQEIEDRLRVLGYGADGLSPLRGKKGGKLKMYGAVGAGDTPVMERDAEMIDAPEEFIRPDYNGLYCEGDSMMPYLHPGDKLVFRDEHRLRRGKVFAFRKPGDTQPCVKEVCYEAGSWWRVAWNETYDREPMGDAQPLGILVGIISKDERLKIGPEPEGIDRDYIVRELTNRLP